MLQETANKTSTSQFKRFTTAKDSLTKVNYLGDVKERFFSGKRDTIGFKGDKGLYAVFKPISKEMYGSTCRAFECFMSATVAAYDHKVNFSLSTNPISLDQNIYIGREMRPRRKLPPVVLPSGDRGRCCVPACTVSGVPLESPEGVVRYFCEFHVDCALKNDWKEVSR